MRRFAPKVTVACLGFAAPSLAVQSTMAPFALQQRSFISVTTPALHGYGASNKGDSRRLTHDERAARRTPKSRDEKLKMEQTIDEAEAFVRQEFGDELEGEFDKIHAKANAVVLRITNMVKCLETLEIPVQGGRKQLLLQMAQILKHSASEIHVVPTNQSFQAQILQRIGRFDSTLNPTKSENKIVCKVVPMTTAKRDKAILEVRKCQNELQQKFKMVRTRSNRYIQDMGIPEHMVKQMQHELDAKVKDVETDKMEILKEFEELIAESGVDEADEVV